VEGWRFKTRRSVILVCASEISKRTLVASSSHSTRPSPRAWAWTYLSAARSSTKPTADGLGRSRANRRVLSFSLRTLLSERTDRDRVDVALWHKCEQGRVFNDPG